MDSVDQIYVTRRLQASINPDRNPRFNSCSLFSCYHIPLLEQDRQCLYWVSDKGGCHYTYAVYWQQIQKEMHDGSVPTPALQSVF
jgi:hypothetical protein